MISAAPAAMMMIYYRIESLVSISNFNVLVYGSMMIYYRIERQRQSQKCSYQHHQKMIYYRIERQL